jgi:uncharacterized protein
MKSRFILVTALGLLVCGAAWTGAAAQSTSSLRVLALTGQDGDHDWEANSSRVLENWGHWGVGEVELRVMAGDEDWVARSGDFADFDAIVFMYYTANAPVEPIQRLADYVSGGGGLVVVHSALAGLSGRQPFDGLIGAGWRGADYGSTLSFSEAGERIVRAPGDGRGAAHPPLMEFQVHTHGADHPITDGLPRAWMQANDELYYSLRGPLGEMNVLATARAPNGEYAPILWTRSHGQGRVFVTTLGHHLPSIDSVGFMTTLTRGLEWAATGEVTSAVPGNFPGGDQSVTGDPHFP